MLFHQLAGSLQISSCSKSDVHRLDDLMQLDEVSFLITVMKSTGLIQLVGNLHQAGKIHNLHQVCGVFGCVMIKYMYIIHVGRNDLE